MSTATLRPCPFCNSTNLRHDFVWIYHDDHQEDVEVVECLDCDAQARVEWWNGKTLELASNDTASTLVG